jgi:multiple sugar transport system substrate-binding protein
MRHILGLLTGLAIGISPALAETTDITVHYPMPGFFKDVMDKIATEYMHEHPDVKITFASPSATYDEGLQLLLREAGTPQMPDVSFVGLNRLRVLAEKNVGVDLKPIIDKDEKIKAEGYTDQILGLGRFRDRQVGLAFAASSPIFYYNADLVKKAGGDPDNMPKDWAGVIKLAAKIQDLGDGVSGMEYFWALDDWMFSALVFSNGGTMMSADEKQIAFNGEAGKKGLKFLERFVKEAKMPVMTPDAMKQAFAAGKVGMFFWTTGALRATINGVGGKFDLRTTSYPNVDPVNGRLPTGGNAMVMFTTDPAKQKVVYDFMKFATGPFGESIVVPGTGYVPTNALAETDDKYLKAFYEKNPLFLAGLKQRPIMVPWYAFPGNNGVKIAQVIVDNLGQLVEQKMTSEETMAEITKETQKLLPR